MIRNMRILLLPVLAIALLALAACSRSGTDEEAFGFAEGAAAPPTFDSAVSIEKEVAVERSVQGVQDALLGGIVQIQTADRYRDYLGA